MKLQNEAPVQAADGNKSDWFFGDLTRLQAESILKERAQDGQFLVRNSETSVRCENIWFARLFAT